VCGWQVKLCDPLVTHGTYLSAFRDKVLYKFSCLLDFTITKDVQGQRSKVKVIGLFVQMCDYYIGGVASRLSYSILSVN